MKEQNIYEELGVRAPQEMLLKAELAFRIMQGIRARRLTQVEAAKLLGVQQPAVSDLSRGRFRSYSIQRLMGYLRKLEPDFRVVLKSGSRKAGASVASPS